MVHTAVSNSYSIFTWTITWYTFLHSLVLIPIPPLVTQTLFFTFSQLMFYLFTYPPKNMWICNENFVSMSLLLSTYYISPFFVNTLYAVLHLEQRLVKKRKTPILSCIMISLIKLLVEIYKKRLFNGLRSWFTRAPIKWLRSDAPRRQEFVTRRGKVPTDIPLWIYSSSA